jgi:hypothetical protein
VAKAADFIHPIITYSISKTLQLTNSTKVQSLANYRMQLGSDRNYYSISFGQYRTRLPCLAPLDNAT